MADRPTDAPAKPATTDRSPSEPKPARPGKLPGAWRDATKVGDDAPSGTFRIPRS